MTGGLVDGELGIVRPKPGKVRRYSRGVWYLLQSKRTDLKRIQMVAGGLVYLFSYKRCLMSCLNVVWEFIASFGGLLGVWRPIPDSVREELFCCAALAPWAYINMRAPYDSTVTASDASESGGGLSFSCGLTAFGVHASDKSVRGLLHEGPDDNQVLVISLFDGIGACRVALDILNAKVAGYSSIESDGAARRVVESAFGSTEFVHSVEEVGDAEVKGWAAQFSRTKIVVVSGGPPCQGVSGLNASRLGSEHDPRSCLHHHVPRIRELVEKYFQWATTYVLMESVASMSEVDRACMSRAVGILPFELDAVGLTPCRRARLFWFTWKVQLEPGVEIQNPLISKAEDYAKISFLLECPPGPYLSPGWALAGGVHQKLPTFTTSQPKAQPGFRPAGIESCTARDLEHWEADNFRFPPSQYRYQHGLLHPKHGWRLPNVNEREAMLGFPLGYTLQSWSRQTVSEILRVGMIVG